LSTCNIQLLKTGSLPCLPGSRLLASQVNPFEGSRSRDFPTPPLVPSHWNDIFSQKTTQMGYHPFPVPAGTISQAYINPLGVRMGPCTYCGYCQLFGCGNWSKSSPNACVVPALMRHPSVLSQK
jgi:gluconate 2-dehydrogenase alpha chain